MTVLIQSGIRQVDKILRGGIYPGTITDIFGSAGSGKTQLSMQFCANAAISGKNAVYHDSSGSFRPERVLTMIDNDQKLLESINVLHMRNTSEQTSALDKISKDTSLVIIDSVTDLFSFEYKRKDQTREKNIAFMQYMHKLADISYTHDIIVVLTNVIRTIDNNTFENMYSALSPYTHTKIQLSNRIHENIPRRGTVETVRGRYEFEYNISDKGVLDPRIP